MGTFTEIYINCHFKKNLPEEVVSVLEYLFNNGNEPLKEDISALNHPFFYTSWWDGIGRSDSIYHVPKITNEFFYEPVMECYYLRSRSDLKNYDEEIEQFFDWVLPYIDAKENHFVGYHRCEDEAYPTLMFKKVTSKEVYPATIWNDFVMSKVKKVA